MQPHLGSHGLLAQALMHPCGTRTARLRFYALAEQLRCAASSHSGSRCGAHLRQSYSAAEFEALADKYAALNWRLMSKPGGATVKPDEFYILYGRAPVQTQDFVVYKQQQRKSLVYDIAAWKAAITEYPRTAAAQRQRGRAHARRLRV